MKSIGSLLATLLLVAWALSPLQASATLVPSPDGITVYDTVNDISWLADADLAATNRFGLPVCTGSGTQPCVNPSGSMNYQAAAAWVQAMNAANYLGHTNWQLPTTPLADSSCGKVGPQDNSFGFGCTLNALGSLYYNALGLKAPNTAVPIPSNTAGPFSNFQPNLYWSQTIGGVPADACYASMACGNATFSFNTGFQGANTLENFIYALPTIAGKIAGTPTATGTGLQVNPGGQTVYDPVTNVTWLANANLAASNTFGLPYCTSPTTPAVCVSRDGAMTLAAASQFISNMNAAAYLGQTNWELPPIGKSCSAYNCNAASDPMAELFYSQLGFKEGTPVVATPDIAVGPFNNIQPYLYWSCQANTIQDACQSDGPATGFEWSFSFGNGFLGTDIQANDFYVTAYFDGPPTSVASPTETPASTSPPTSSPTTTPTGTCTATPTQVPTATRAHTAPATVLATPAPSSTVRTPTPTPSATVHSSATPTPPSSPTPSRSTTPTGSCTGDCNGDGQVTVDEILTMVNIALASAPAAACPYGIPNGAQVDVALILQAVNQALNGCPTAPPGVQLPSGIYVLNEASNEQSTTTAYASGLTSSPAYQNDITGHAIFVPIAKILPSITTWGQFNWDWTYLDTLVQIAVSNGKTFSVELETGFQSSSAYLQSLPDGFAAACDPDCAPLFDVWATGGSGGTCISAYVLLPWVPKVQEFWSAAAAALAAHLQQAGVYGSLTLIHVPGLSVYDEEIRLPTGYPSPSPTDTQACPDGRPAYPTVINDASTSRWQGYGYSDTAVIDGFKVIATAFAQAFPDRALGLSLFNPGPNGIDFPNLTDDPVGYVASQIVQEVTAIALGRVQLQSDNLDSNFAQSEVTTLASQYSDAVGWQTNKHAETGAGCDGGGAGSCGPDGPNSPYFHLLQNGAQNRGAYLEVWSTDVVNYPQSFAAAKSAGFFPAR